MNPTAPKNRLVVPFIITVLVSFLFGVAALTFYFRYKDASTDLSAQIDKATAESNAELETRLQAEFEEEAKSPYQKYSSPAQFNSIVVTYPKSWSAYVIENAERGELEGYFHPVYVPDVGGDTLFALKMELTDNEYAKEVESYDKLVDQGAITAGAVSIKGVKGIRFDGQIEKDFKGSIVLMPIRDKTFKIWTENTKFEPDFTNIILKNLDFSP